MPVSPARAAAFDILLRVDRQNAYASELLHSEKLERLSPTDRSLATELVMGVLRWRSRLDEIIAGAASRPLNKLDIEVLNALRLAAYQLQFLTRVPARAAINESVELVKRAQKRSAAPFANAVLRNLAESKTTPVEYVVEMSAPALARDFAHPEWLVARWCEQFGIERASRICEFDQRVPGTVLRLDSLEVEQELLSEGIGLEPGELLARARIVLTGDVTQT